MKRRHFFTALAGMATEGCSRKGAPQLRSVLVGALPYLSMSGFYLARELGYFSDAGLDVQVQQLPGAQQAIPLLAGGKLDVSFAALSPAFINAAGRGARARIVAGREIISPAYSDNALYGRRAAFPRGLKVLKELAGKRIAIPGRAMIAEFWLDAILERAELSQSDVQIVMLGHSESVAALLAGKIDAMLGGSFADRSFDALSPDILLGIRLADVLPNSQFSHVIFGERLLDGALEVGARFLAAYLRGSREFMRGRTPRFLDEYARANGLDPKRAREAHRNTVTADGSIDMQSLQRYRDWAVRKGYCPEAVRVSQLVDTRFLDEAYRRFLPRDYRNA
ncbi:MAG: ABC transporter substrate-binding protein [Bryobacteraceae bacterium]|jgi:ABC-type nitrate/sulfonate/bicarbonate transport system substrate-binding protein